MKKIEVIQGAKHTDSRGVLYYNNDLDFKPVQRFYIIEQDLKHFRAWQGHKVEQKWFQVIKGSFKIFVVAPDAWDKPSPNLDIQEFILTEDENKVLHLSGGYATGIRAVSEGSKLAIFSDMDLQSSVSDSFRFSPDTWEI